MTDDIYKHVDELRARLEIAHIHEGYDRLDEEQLAMAVRFKEPYDPCTVDVWAVTTQRMIERLTARVENLEAHSNELNTWIHRIAIGAGVVASMLVFIIWLVCH